MVLKPEPVFAAFEAIPCQGRRRVLLMSPQGKPLHQTDLQRWAGGGGAVTSGAGAAATGGGLGATAGSAAAGRLFVARGAWIGAAVLVWMGAG